MSPDEKQPGDPPQKTIRDDLAQAPGEITPIDPVEMARRDLKKSLPRRFYSRAHAAPGADAFALLLDGRPARTPARNRLELPTLAAAEAVAAEWDRQQEIIDPADMPLTRIVNSAIDGVAGAIEATVADIAKFGGSDLVCYRAGEPEALTLAEAAAWDPVLDFAREKLGARLICAQGINYVEQPEPARRALLQAVEDVSRPELGGAIALAALHVMTSLTGSALLALGVAHGALTPQQAFAAAHVDEDYQMTLWGVDDAALARRAGRWSEMEAAALLLQAVRPPASGRI